MLTNAHRLAANNINASPPKSFPEANCPQKTESYSFFLFFFLSFLLCLPVISSLLLISNFALSCFLLRQH